MTLAVLLYFCVGVVLGIRDSRNFLQRLGWKYPMLPPTRWDATATEQTVLFAMIWPVLTVVQYFMDWPIGHKNRPSGAP